MMEILGAIGMTLEIEHANAEKDLLTLGGNAGEKIARTDFQKGTLKRCVYDLHPVTNLCHSPDR